jgi:hypothetical protein
MIAFQISLSKEKDKRFGLEENCEVLRASPFADL